MVTGEAEWKLAEWKLRKEIEKRDSRLIEKVKALVDIFFQKKEEIELEESQIRNLLDVAQKTESVEKVKLFIMYQIGRHKEKIGDLGEPLISYIDEELKREAEDIQRRIDEELKREAEEDIQRRIKGAPPPEEIWAKLVARLFGFLYWYYYFKKRVERGNK